MHKETKFPQSLHLSCRFFQGVNWRETLTLFQRWRVPGLDRRYTVTTIRFGSPQILHGHTINSWNNERMGYQIEEFRKGQQGTPREGHQGTPWGTKTRVREELHSLREIPGLVLCGLNAVNCELPLKHKVQRMPHKFSINEIEYPV